MNCKSMLLTAGVLASICGDANARFVSADPVRADPNSGANFNRYWYADNNPYTFVDPDGRDSMYARYMSHMYRNANQSVPADAEAAKAAGWRQMSAAQSQFHTQGEQGKGNTKWVDSTGHMEAVYDADGNLVTDTLNGGTYNFAPPDEMVDHTVEDVVPYLVWGNGPIIVDLSPRPNQDPEAPSGDEAPGEGESEEEPRKPELPERPLVPSRD